VTDSGSRLYTTCYAGWNYEWIRQPLKHPLANYNCNWILENVPFWHISQADIANHPYLPALGVAKTSQQEGSIVALSIYAKELF